MNQLRVLIFDDSATRRAALRQALASARDLELVAEATTGSGAAKLVARVRPSIIVMDIVMPERDGYQATREIMATVPTPIVMMSSVVHPHDASAVFEALAAGALCITEALPGPTDPQYRLKVGAFLQLLRSMATAKVGRSLPRAGGAAAVVETPKPPPQLESSSAISAIGIVASAGGPAALVELLRALQPGTLPPLYIVQHMASGFTSAFGEWLGAQTGHTVETARSGQLGRRGAVYLAPEDYHLCVQSDGRIELSRDPPYKLFRPSGTELFRSLARAFGKRALGVVLTGMGDDGADGAVAIRAAGGAVAAQNEATSAIYGMPGETRKRGGADVDLPLVEIARWLTERSGA